MTSIRVQVGLLETITVPLDKRTIVLSDSDNADIFLGLTGESVGEWRIEWMGSGEFDPAVTHLSDWRVSFHPKSIGEIEDGRLDVPLRLGGLEFQEAKSDYFDDSPAVEFLAREVARCERSDRLVGRAENPIRIAQVDQGKVIHIRFLSYPVGLKVRVPELPGFKLKRISAEAVRIIFPDQSARWKIRLMNGSESETIEPSAGHPHLDLATNRHAIVEVSETEVHVGLADPVSKDEIATFHLAYFRPLFIFLAVLLLGLIFIENFDGDKKTAPLISSRPTEVEVKVIPIEKILPPPIERQLADTQPEERGPVPAEEADAERLPPKKVVSEREDPGGQRHRSKVRREKKIKPNSLDSMARRGDIDQVGLLNSLKKSTDAQVTADKIINDGLVNDRQKGVLQAPIRSPAGQVSKVNTPEESRLVEAKTTLDRTTQFNRSASSPLAGEGPKRLSSKNYQEIAQPEAKVVSQQVTGGLSPQEVTQSMTETRSRIKKCYEEALTSNPTLGGKMVYSWTVTGQGQVQRLKLVESDIKFPRLDLCIQNEIQNTQFKRSPSGKSSNVRYSFALEEM